MPELPRDFAERPLDQALLIQFAVSIVAIIVLAGAAAWARIPRGTQPLDEASARAIIGEELPDVRLDRVWVDAAGAAAVARSGEEGVILMRVGDSYAVRTAPWREIARPRVEKGRAVFCFADPGCPAAVFRLADDRLPFGETA